jgi:gliding motility-associated-like protein
VYIPNSFSPNFDGINDVFMPIFTPYGLDTETYEFVIFDRWGHPVYSTRDHTKGWDGTFMNKGTETLKQDSYNYSVKYKDIDGRVYHKTGVVTLL